LLVGLALGAEPRSRTESTVTELGQLAESAGATVVGSVIQQRSKRDPATLLGRGKVEDVRQLSHERGADLILFDEELSPAQQRNLEDHVGKKTLDRTQLILDIFARRARTREGRLQVELAQLDYLLPRLAGSGVMLSRLGGGIGTRGPGETKLETDRRRIRQRIQSVRREIERVRRERRTRREGRRQASEAPIVALVGYTNAGKSTLFSALTHAATPASSKLFVTLDPLVRRARLGGGLEILTVDTVGFIQKLPTTLVAAFRATLEEVAYADLLLEVSDASAEDLEEREAAVAGVLSEIGAGGRPRLQALNKIDCLSESRRETLHASRPDAILVSATTGLGLPELRSALVARLDMTPRRVRLRLPARESKLLAAVYGAGRVTGHDVAGEHVVLDAELPARLLERYRDYLV
jgi:GTP-binding protein HflX